MSSKLKNKHKKFLVILFIFVFLSLNLSACNLNIESGKSITTNSIKLVYNDLVEEEFDRYLLENNIIESNDININEDILIELNIKPKIQKIEQKNTYENIYQNIETGQIIDLNKLILGDMWNEDGVFNELCEIVTQQLPDFLNDEKNIEFIHKCLEHRQENEFYNLNISVEDYNLFFDLLMKFHDTELAHKNGRIKIFEYGKNENYCIFKYNDYIGNGSPTYIYDIKNNIITELVTNWILIDSLSTPLTFNKDYSVMYLTFYDQDGMISTGENSYERINYRGDFAFMVMLDGSNSIKMGTDIHAGSKVFLSPNEKVSYYKVYNTTNEWAFFNTEDASLYKKLKGNIVGFANNDSIVVIENKNKYDAYLLKTGENVTDKNYIR